MVYVNINFTGHLLLGFGRYCGKVLPKQPAVFHLFWAPALTNNVLSIFLSGWSVVNNSRNKRVFAFLLYLIGFETIFIYFSWKWVISDQTYSFKNKELLIITKKCGQSLVQQCFVKLFTKFQGKPTHRSGTGARRTW